MPSIHAWKAIEVARRQGGFAGQDCARPFWEMSKRELIEILLRLGSLNVGLCDDADAGAALAMEEHRALKTAGII
jgi:hypothetical protein